MTKTPNLNLNVPDYQDERWDVPVNENWDLIDTAVAAKANDSDVVKLTGNQTIGGAKTFKDKTTLRCIEFMNEESIGHGGYIDFHYNNNSEDFTSRIIEDKSGNIRLQSTTATAPTPATSDSSTKIATTANVDAKITAQAVKLTGDQTVAGIKTFTESIKRVHVFGGASVNTIQDVDSNHKGSIAITPYYTGNKVYHRMSATNNTSGKHAYLDITVDDSGNAGLQYSGNASTFNVNFANATQVNAPTPSTTDNSTKIATTAFFRNNMQVVDALPANPVEGVFYYVPDNSLPQQMTNYDYVVDYKTPTDADPTWYRVYKSGWIEQGGILPKKDNWNAVTITFPKPFANTLYTVLTSTGYTTNTDANTITGKTNTTFTTTGYNSTGFAGWQASGQGA